MTKEEKRNFVCYFVRILESEGDMFFSSNNLDEDYSLITGTIRSQGYWAGNKLRYFFDDNLKFLDTEERKFGA